MDIKELCRALSCSILNAGNQETIVSGCYTGDLLSWVMSRAQNGDAWITVMGNVNAIAVASLAEAACIILAENVDLDPDAKAKASAQNIWVLQSPLTSYELCKRIAGLL